MGLPVASVQVDIALLTFEVGRVPYENRAEWLTKLVECLARRKPELHPYGAQLLQAAEEYREQKSHKNRANAITGWEKRKENAESSEPMRPQQNDATAQVRMDILPTDAIDRQVVRQTDSETLSLQKLSFDDARKAYPGTKRGLEPEWKNFQKKFGKRGAEIIPLLLPAVMAYRTKVERDGTEARFIAHFATWVNQERWTQEFSRVNGSRPHPTAPMNRGLSDEALV